MFQFAILALTMSKIFVFWTQHISTHLFYIFSFFLKLDLQLNCLPNLASIQIQLELIWFVIYLKNLLLYFKTQNYVKILDSY